MLGAAFILELPVLGEATLQEAHFLGPWKYPSTQLPIWAASALTQGLLLPQGPSSCCDLTHLLLPGFQRPN